MGVTDRRGGGGDEDNPTIIRESFSGMNRSIDPTEYNWKSYSFARAPRTCLLSFTQSCSSFPPPRRQKVNVRCNNLFFGVRRYDHFEFPDSSSSRLRLDPLIRILKWPHFVTLLLIRYTLCIYEERFTHQTLIIQIKVFGYLERIMLWADHYGNI